MTNEAGVKGMAGVAGRAQSTGALWWVILVSLVIRIAFANSVGLGIDESYTAVTARQLHLSYFDHPPLAWWLAWAARNLFGSVDPLLLRLPFIFLFSVSTWLMFNLTAVLFGARAGLWAAAALCLSPVFGVVFGSCILPDGPLIAAMLATGLCLAKLFFDPGKRTTLYWLGAGLFGGLAMLSKYQSVFLFAGTFIFLLTVKGERRWLTRAEPYLGLAIAIAVFTPVLVWNAEHDWHSFHFQGARATFAAIRPSRALVVILGQAAYLAPWIWVPIVIATFNALKRGPSDARAWLPICLGLGPICAFLLVSIWSADRVLPHWAMPGYLMLFPLLGAAMARYEKRPAGTLWSRRWLYGATAFLVGAVVVVASEARLGWVERMVPAVAAKGSLGRALLDWRGLETALRDRGLLDRRGLFVLMSRWQEAAKVAYALDGTLPVLCISADPRQFNVLNDLPVHDGQDALILGSRLSREQAENRFGRYFQSIRPLPPITIEHAGHPVIKIEVFYGTRFDARAVRYGWLKESSP
jgi:4-amino-4-deoxy-L-arabinose transferase-like glycosyltransferase